MNASTLTTAVDKFRELAREILRMRWINNIKNVILGLDTEIADYNTEKEAIKKCIARHEYAISKLDEADPDYQDLLDKHNKAITSHNETLAEIDKQIEEVNKEKVEELAKIDKVVSGELKVNADNLSTKAKELAEAYGNQQARDLIV